MQRFPVESSSIHSIGYDPATAILELEFHAGAVYQYFMVPPSTFEALRSAPSIGAFVNRHIRPRFRYVQVSEGS